MVNSHVVLAARRRTAQREADAVHVSERTPAATPGALPIYAWFGVEPPAGLRCSDGCHLLGPNANFDPHTGDRVREARQPSMPQGMPTAALHSLAFS